MASVEGDDSDGIITKQLLKSRSGEFDIESIHTMKIKNAGITDMGCLGECTALQRLDLSYNQICRLHKLASLTALTHLNLSANRITVLDGLQALEHLQNLNVCGNLIGSVDSLRCLSGLEHLKVLRLQDQATGLSNPMCNTPYVDQVLIMLPVLATLDGDRVRGKGSELYELCKSMDKALKELSAVNASEPVPHEGNLSNVVAQQWVVDNGNSKDLVLEAEESLRAMLQGCRQISKTAAEMLMAGRDGSAQPKDESPPS